MRSIIVFLVVWAFPRLAAAQIRYDVSFPNARHHEAEITLTVADLPNEPVQLRMSRSSPGRYAIHEFAKNVYNVRVVDGDGRPLEVVRPNPYQWDVPQHEGAIRVTYTLFADRADGTYAQVDPTHAHLNIPATFMWARGLGDRPIEVTFRPPPDAGWRVATQLFPTDDPWSFTAPNLQYFMDSPTELSDHARREWSVGTNDDGAVIRLAVHHRGTDADVDEFAAMVQAIVAEEIAVFGEPPSFDGGTYTFIADYLPYASGDGMEHRNSTILASQGSLAQNALGLLGTVSHEFFHAWNVERLRPRALEPFDFERANMSRELWFAEGFTSYYTPVFITRAGLFTLERYAASISGGLDAVINGPGRRFFSPAEMSMQAPFVDAATSIDPNNRINTFISYYTWGAVTGLGLDLTLRTRFDRDLDGFMRLLWERYGKTARPYTPRDLEVTLGDYAGDPRFAEVFFARFIWGRDVPDFGPLLASAGLLLRPARAGEAWIGDVQWAPTSGGVMLQSGTTIGSPLYDAGLDRGDVVTQLNGRVVRDADDVHTVLAALEPGSEITVNYTSRDGRRTERMVLGENPHLEVVPFERVGRVVTEEVRGFRERWLGGRRAGDSGQVDR